VATSAVLGSVSIVILFAMLLVMYLSSRKVGDDLLLAVGAVCWIVGGLLMYFLWTSEAQAWHFFLPVAVCVAGFPFIMATNRSMFTKAVESIPELEDKSGFMQSVLSMFASVAGFV
jgi:Na+/melibiose symporter-like transporter